MPALLLPKVPVLKEFLFKKEKMIWRPQQNVYRLDVVLRVKEGYQNLTAACTLKVFEKKSIALHIGTYNITVLKLVLLCHNINENIQGWKCLMASTEILEAIDPASHLSTFKRSRIFCFAT